MSEFCEDDQAVARYPQGIFGWPRPQNLPLIRCLQWGADVQDSERDITLQTANELTDTAVKDRLRVVFMPTRTQATSAPDVLEFKKLFKCYSVPSDVLTERTRSVNHSFGSSQAIDSKAQISWCRFVCRNINVYSGKIQKVDYLRNDKGGQIQTSSSLNLWITCDIFLHAAEDKSVTLICFGALDSVSLRFEKLLTKKSWDDVLQVPYLLYPIVFDELHEVFDSLGKVLALPLRKVEVDGAAIGQAGPPSLTFRHTQEVQKNVTFMIESAEAVISTLDAMLENLDDFDVPTADNPKKLRKSTVSAIRYRRRTFKSTLLRVCSIERRASSGTQIYQAQLAQADSHAMKSIAFLTLMFLPVTGVATIFSSPFFNVDFDKDSTPLRVAWCFWKFWAVVGPLTFGMCLLCYFWYRFPGFFSFVHAFLTKEFWARRCEETRRRQERRKQEKLGV